MQAMPVTMFVVPPMQPVHQQVACLALHMGVIMIQQYTNKDLIEGRSCFATPVKVYKNNDGKKPVQKIMMVKKKTKTLLNYMVY